MKWFILIMMIAFTYSDARPVQSAPTREISKPLEDLAPMLDSVATKLTDLTLKIERL